MKEIVRWGMIGCGDVAERKSGPGLYKAEGSALEIVMDIDKSVAKKFAERHKIKKWTDNADALIMSPDIDAIYIATPPDSHCHYAKLVAAAGKAVLVEKPMARTLAEAEELVKCCKDAGVPLFVSYYRRAMPRFLKVKEWIDNKKIGKPLFVNIQHHSRSENHPVAPIDSKNPPVGDDIPWRFVPDISGGGNFVDCGTHIIDMVDYLLGPLSEINGKAWNKGGLYLAEDTVSGKFVVNNDIPGTCNFCYISDNDVDKIEIVGDKGSIRFSCFDSNALELQIGDEVEYVETSDEYVHQPIIQTVVDELLGKGKSPSNGENALRAMHVQDCYLSEYYS